MPTKLIKLLRMELIPPDVGEYFTSLVKSVVSYREENNVTRCDFLDLLIALRNNTQTEKYKDLQEEEDLGRFLEQTGDKYTKNNVGKWLNCLGLKWSFLYSDIVCNVVRFSVNGSKYSACVGYEVLVKVLF